MVRIATVRFSDDRMPIACLVGDVDIDEGDHCVVRCDKGEVVGLAAVIEPHPCLHADQCGHYPKVLRRASDREIEKTRKLLEREQEAKVICRRKVAEHKLPMKISTVDIHEAQNKIVFHFTADKRVDFRALVRDLASTLHARIELWQIGVRDEAKIIDGYGICGKRLCCAGFFREFKPISIKMAKNQDIALAPSKLSGCCGRLMCCLAYEEEAYLSLARSVPPIGVLIRTDGLEAIVVDRDVLKQTVQVMDREQHRHTVAVADINQVCELRDSKGRKIKRLKDLEEEATATEVEINMIPPDDEGNG